MLPLMAASAEIEASRLLRGASLATQTSGGSAIGEAADHRFQLVRISGRNQNAVEVFLEILFEKLHLTLTKVRIGSDA